MTTTTPSLRVTKRNLERSVARIKRGESSFINEERKYFGETKARGSKLRRLAIARGVAVN